MLSIIEFEVWPETPREQRLSAKITQLQYDGFLIVDVSSMDLGLTGTRYFIKYEPLQSRCPMCGTQFAKPDDTAVHLQDAHGWDTQRVTLWLRNRVEEGAFNDLV